MDHVIRAKPGRLACRLFRLGLFLLCSQVWAEGNDRSRASLFERTAILAEMGGPDVRSDFALIALTSLTAAYEEEASLAVEEARSDLTQAELVGWSSSVLRYARQFEELMNDVTDGEPLAITVDEGRSVSIAIKQRTVILSHPRPGRQSMLEQSIIEQFCRGGTCAQLETEVDELAVPVYNSAIRPLWSFDEGGPVCTHDEVALRFPIDATLSNAREICQQFLEEIARLRQELAKQLRRGVYVDWSNIQVHAVPVQESSRVELNDRGDSIIADLPILGRNPRLLILIQPWLRSQFIDAEPITLQLHAADL